MLLPITANAKKVHPEAIRGWRPSGQVWPLLRELQGRVIGLRKCRMEIDGATMVWLEGGNLHGAPVVLLHGFASNKENWLLLLPFLAKRYRLYVPDLPACQKLNLNECRRCTWPRFYAV